jgi:hypothetical protein
MAGHVYSEETFFERYRAGLTLGVRRRLLSGARGMDATIRAPVAPSATALAISLMLEVRPCNSSDLFRCGLCGFAYLEWSDRLTHACGVP